MIRLTSREILRKGAIEAFEGTLHHAHGQALAKGFCHLFQRFDGGIAFCGILKPLIRLIGHPEPHLTPTVFRMEAGGPAFRSLP